MGFGSRAGGQRVKHRPVSFPDCSQEGVGGNSPVDSSRFATTTFDRLRILETYQHIAMIGLSANPFRPSHFAAIYLVGGELQNRPESGAF